jgi:GT2 family glycosyltransferase
MKSVSAVIVNWNGKEVTAECVRSLLAQNHPDLEIIVSDNGSTDGSVEHLRAAFADSVRIIENHANLGFGAAVNRGFQIAHGNYLLFLNNDLTLASDAVAELARELDTDAAIGGAVPKILYHENRDTINSYGVEVNYTGVAYPRLIDCRDSHGLASYETPCGGIFMMRREVYAATGGFDEDFFLYHEDHDLSWRIRLLGWKLVVRPTAVFYHHYHFHKGVRKFYTSEKNRLRMLLKNFSLKTLALIAPGLALVEAAQLAHALGNGWFFLKLKSYVELLGDWADILKKRRIVQRSRAVSDREITRLHLGTLRISGVKHPLLDQVLSPTLNYYWLLIRQWI